jgi:hypothetical protein
MRKYGVEESIPGEEEGGRRRWIGAVPVLIFKRPCGVLVWGDWIGGTVYCSMNMTLFFEQERKMAIGPLSVFLLSQCSER